MGKIKDNWQLAVFTLLITIVGSGIWTYFQNRDSKINQGATVEYVDKRHEDQKIYIDECDNAITLRLDRVQAIQQTKADKDDVDKIFEMSKANNEQLIENNRLLIDIALKIKEIK